DAATNQNEALVFDKLIVNCLGGDIAALKITRLNRGRDLRKVHRLAVLGEDNKNLVADIFWINGRPFYKTPVVLEVSKQFADACERSHLVWVLMVKLAVQRFDRYRLPFFFDSLYNFIDIMSQFFFVAIFFDCNGMIIVVIFVY